MTFYYDIKINLLELLKSVYKLPTDGRNYTERDLAETKISRTV